MWRNYDKGIKKSKMVKEVENLDALVSSKTRLSIGDYVKVINRSIWN